MDFGLETRKDILFNALMMESLTSGFLAGLVGIKDYTSSKSFGNTGASLSFSQKVNLLIDMGALEDVTRKKFKAFMEVRNQFMHNLEAVSYTNCFKYAPDTGKFILKTYPQDVKKSEEEQLSLAVEKLTSEVLNLTGDLIEKLKEKFYDDAKANVYKVV